MPRILFVKTSSLGDVVHNGPAVSDVARHLPGAQIDWVVEQPFAEIAALHGAVRRVIPVAIRRWRAAPFARTTWAQFGAFRRALRAQRYERVIDTQGLLKSALVCALAQGEKHGFDRDSAREPLAARFYDAGHGVSRDLHAVERNRRLCAEALDFAAQGSCDYGFHCESADPPDAGAPLAVLLSISSRPQKLWAEPRWIELGCALAAKGLQCVLPSGNAAERLRCERIAMAIPRAVAPPLMTLAELARLMRRARCVVGLDTGLAHLGAALGTVAIGIFCGSDPRLTGLYGAARARNVGGPGAPPEAAQVLAALESLA